jgi:hypothetical protein
MLQMPRGEAETPVVPGDAPLSWRKQRGPTLDREEARNLAAGSAGFPRPQGSHGQGGGGP